jgi:hypothetical protein
MVHSGDGAWGQEYIDMEVPGHFTFNKDGTGHFQFGLVQGEMDCRSENKGGRARTPSSWDGQEELDPASGRGWAVIEDQELKGRIFFHQGDDSAFRVFHRTIVTALEPIRLSYQTNI